MSYISRGHICQCLSRLTTFRRDAVVIIHGSRRKTGKKFVDEVLILARGLIEVGIKPGDVVAICALNSDWYLEWLLAVSFVGGIAAPLNYRWSLEESKFALGVVNPVMLVTDESFSYMHSKIETYSLSSLKWRVFIGSSPDFMSNQEVLTMEMLKKLSPLSTSFNYIWAPEDIAMICFTSGTTGRPKGVALSHSAIIVQSMAKIAIVGYSEDDIYLHTAPLCHIGGISSAMAMLMIGGCHVLIPKFEAKLALSVIDQHNVTCFISVPAIMSDLILPIRMKEPCNVKKSVTKILNGGGGLSSKLISNAARFFPRAKILSAYGMTETCSSLTFMTLYDPTTLKESNSNQFIIQKYEKSKINEGVCIGKPAPHVELRIHRESSSHVGKILTRGPHVMLRYWNQNPGKEIYMSDGTWLDTGDLGYIDVHGNLWLLGRTNSRIKSGGENIYPEEVEAILIQHPGLSAIVVVGVPDPRLTEKVVACFQLQKNWRWDDSASSEFIARDEEHILSSQNLQNFCRQNILTGFKIPKVFILWRKNFPVTSSGKLRRVEIQREAMSHVQSLHSNL